MTPRSHRPKLTSTNRTQPAMPSTANEPIPTNRRSSSPGDWPRRSISTALCRATT